MAGDRKHPKKIFFGFGKYDDDLLIRLFSAHLVLGLLLLEQEVAEDVHWHWEDDGGVVLGGDAVQGLEVPQLENTWEN